jgi:hypothetical protein
MRRVARLPLQSRGSEEVRLAASTPKAGQGNQSREARRRETMSSDLTVALQGKARTDPGSSGDVIVASIWFVLYLLMVVGSLFANQKEPAVLLVVLAATLGGWRIFGWRRKKRTLEPIVADKPSAEGETRLPEQPLLS